MDTYYLWYRGDDGIISVGSRITRGDGSKFLVEVERGGLDEGLAALKKLAGQYGKKRCLEVHCHGDPAALHLGANNAVSNFTVKSFALAVKEALLPGGTIELLACSVAKQGDWYDMFVAPKTRIAGYREDYHGVLRLRATRNYTYDNGMGDRHAPFYGGGFTAREKPFAADANKFFAPKFETDGLKFCLEMAITSGCTVRAACEVQSQEGDYYQTRMPSPIGNWEWEVFDFQPDGMIQFLGPSPYRDPISGLNRISKFMAA